jgi:hypothetical protein
MALFKLNVCCESEFDGGALRKDLDCSECQVWKSDWISILDLSLSLSLYIYIYIYIYIHTHTHILWGVSNPLCRTSSLALHFFQLFFFLSTTLLTEMTGSYLYIQWV